MGYELVIPKIEAMKQKAKEYLEGMNPEEFKSIDELVAYVYYLHVLSAEYLDIVAEVLAEKQGAAE